MGSKNAKTIRKEAKGLYQVALDEVINPRLNAMEAYVKEQMEKMALQQKRINGFVVGEVKFTIANELDDSKVTRYALLEVLNEKLQIPGLLEEVEARKPDMRKRLIAAAEEKMKADQEAARAQAEAGALAQAALAAQGNPNLPEQGPPNADQPAQPAQEQPNG